MNISIRGTGIISAAGVGVADNWNNTAEGRRFWSTDDATKLPVYALPYLPAAGRPADYIRTHRVDRTVALALHAAEEAVAQAGWHGQDFAVLVGCSRGPTTAWEAAHQTYREGKVLPVRTSPTTTLGSIAFALADYFGVSSLSDGLSVTCSSGFHALVHGVALLRAGMADRVLVGGTEAPLTPFTLRQMEGLRIYASPTPGEEYACRPFATPATGMVVGEGAGFLALERAPQTGSLGILGLGFSREQARSATGISREGTALQSSMRQATIGAATPDLILAHAPGTLRGDEAERRAITSVFPETLPPVLSLKWATGHTFGASGPLALVMATEMVRRNAVIVLPYGPATEVPSPPRRVLVNATGFGGNAVSVLIG
ncbi:beta-ketoacyl synthase N-terminal-like domain-containing protein [Lewinella sp. JB7]|uniref:beta-ketoacyl synthase N-terminal-like domain-containing protein n=1 Tax=Lewinella sp. JB7 TaxID=2962887 RepID=UPI0020C986C6|nr:beta-ketoacyl synthase N-terminal-like domain-containing protein [Lewinella sp. JB7]MCP9235125.1 hypothetical protein [Lewinella sp. JB7]